MPGRTTNKARSPIVWTSNNGVKPSTIAKSVPRYAGTSEIPDEMLGRLCVGDMWYAVVNMSPDQSMVDKALPVLMRHKISPEKSLIKEGSILIYTGEVRVDEQSSRYKSRIVSVIRHTFFAASGRYIIADFTMIRPV